MGCWRPRRLLSAWLCGALALPGCMQAVGKIEAPTPDNAAGDDAFRMVAVPSDDATILGRVLMSEPTTASSFEAEARPNPCAHYLEPLTEHNLRQEVHRAQRLGGSAEAKATLHGFGFSGSASGDTHLVFDLSTEKKIVRRDSTEYMACCRSHDCGFGYISTLVYGRGEYASGRETRVQGEADYLGLAGAGGTVDVAASERKRVQGWVLAVVTPHEVLRNMDDTRSKAFIAGGAASFALGLGGLGLMSYGLVQGPKLEKDHARQPEARDDISTQIDRANAMAIAGGVTGGLFTAAGVALLVVGVHGRQTKRVSVAPARRGVAVTGRF